MATRHPVSTRRRSPGARVTEKRVLLRNEVAAPVVEVDRLDLARIRRGEGDVASDGGFVGEEGHEERVAGQHALAGGLELVPHALPAATGGIERRRHRDALLHVHHRAGLGDDGLTGVERDDDTLEVIANELVVDFVGAHGSAEKVESGI
jgi:hypothetical protein